MDQEIRASPFHKKKKPQLTIPTVPSSCSLWPVLSCLLSSTWMFDVVLFVFKVILKGSRHQPAIPLSQSPLPTPGCVWLTEVPGCFISPSQKAVGAPLNST